MNSAPANPAAVRADQIHAGYAAADVLRGISLSVEPGQVFAIVGPNGSGKSTLLRVLAGSMRRRGGTVEICGRPLESYDRRALAKVVASVAQENQVAFRFTVLELVLMGRAPHLGAFRFESHADLEIAREALAHFDLLEFAHRHVEELSGGERKRVFLARALAQQPRVVMLDEPTAFLDLRHVAGIFARFRELAAERAMAVIATLHDLNAAATYADRVMLLKDGVAVATGTPVEVLTEENLRRVYELEVYVGRNPSTGALAILPSGRPPARA
ncbi:MAG TPA: ABC transporter ATP-binding protein [Candidatus Binataceae bacterium]|nr:ABC transporter ATP-binding protein [Candidatus Binataceae bacterium]